MRLDHVQTEGATIKHGISADHHAAQIDLLEQGGGKGNFAPFLLHIHVSQHDALLWMIESQQMHPFRFSQGDGSSQRLAIQGKLDASPFRTRRFERVSKKRSHALLYLVWLDSMSQNSTPRAGVWHARSFEMEQFTQFTCSQFGPVSHATAATFTRLFGAHSDHQQASQCIAHPSVITMIG